MSLPLLVVGLGNPGQKYAATRHNIGFIAADAIVRRYNFSGPQLKFKAEVFEGKIGGQKVLVVKPQTFMNLSGETVQAMVQFYKLPLSQVVVIHDELDLLPGKVRMKLGGGAAGHNGLRSIDQLAGNEFHRMRIGIGHPGDKDLVHSYVLGPMMGEESKQQEVVIGAIVEAFPLLAEGQEKKFLSKVALIIHPPKPKEIKKKELEKNGL